MRVERSLTSGGNGGNNLAANAKAARHPGGLSFKGE